MLTLCLCAATVWAQTGKTNSPWVPPGDPIVKITALGSKTGEFCTSDRAFILEDPTGVRILYDPGTTVAGSSDGRLGQVHVALLSHVHSDHLGNAKLAGDPGGTEAKCDGTFPKLPTVPNSNLAEIAAFKNSAVLVSADIAPLLSSKIQALRNTPTPSCPATGAANSLVVPLSAPCVGNIGFGAKRTVTMAEGAPGVQIAVVTAIHGNALANNFLSSPLADNLSSNALSVTLGPPVGYVLSFSNGLAVYLSGDTGQTADMRAVVHQYYRAKLAILNIGDIFTTGPEEAAYAAQNLLHVKAVIPSHANEVATSDGQLLPGTKTARFVNELGRLPVFLPLSGHTVAFDGNANCVAGCDAFAAPVQ